MGNVIDYSSNPVTDYNGGPVTDYFPGAYVPWSGQINFPGSALEAAVAAVAPTPNYQIIPLSNSPNQTLLVTLLVDGSNLTLQFGFRYNEMASYWVMQIVEPSSGQIILDSIPLVTGDYPAANILSQYAYMQIGSCYLVKVGATSNDYPDDTDLGTDFVLVWSDTPSQA